VFSVDGECVGYGFGIALLFVSVVVYSGGSGLFDLFGLFSLSDVSVFGLVLWFVVVNRRGGFWG